MNFDNVDWPLIAEATTDTLLMTGFSIGYRWWLLQLKANLHYWFTFRRGFISYG